LSNRRFKTLVDFLFCINHLQACRKQILLSLMESKASMQMPVEGFTEYKRREFCKDVSCPVQISLNSLVEGSVAYEQTRQKCSSACLYTTWQFHHWLIEKGYLILKPAEKVDK